MADNSVGQSTKTTRIDCSPIDLGSGEEEGYFYYTENKTLFACSLPFWINMTDDQVEIKITFRSRTYTIRVNYDLIHMRTKEILDACLKEFFKQIDWDK